MMNFKSAFLASAAVLAACCGSAFAGVIDVSTAAGITANGTINWASLGGENANPTISQPFDIATGISGVSAHVSEPGESNFTRQDQGGLWRGNFAAGEKLLWTTNQNVMTIVFSSLVRGVGAQIQTNQQESSASGHAVILPKG